MFMNKSSKITSVRIDHHKSLKKFAADHETTLASIVNESIEKNSEVDLEDYK